MSAKVVESDSVRSEKVVIRSGGKIFKGYLDHPIWDPAEKLARRPPDSFPSSFRIRDRKSDVVEEIPCEDLNAVFYVKSFEGNPERRDINFHNNLPTVEGIWMRLEFDNGEVMEGLVYNSLRYLVDPGFFLIPTDPESNNKLVYVMKKAIVDHRILGTLPL